MATMRMVTEIKTLPMDEKERVVVPPNRFHWRSEDQDVLTPSQVFTLIHQTAFGEAPAGDYQRRARYDGTHRQMVGPDWRDIGAVRMENMRSPGFIATTFEGIKLAIDLPELLQSHDEEPWYSRYTSVTVRRRVTVKTDGTFSIRDLRSKVAELQALLDEIDAERKRQQAETLRKREEAEAARNELYYRTTALLKNLGDIPPSEYNAIYQGSYCMDTGVFASVFDLQKEEIALSINGLTVEQAKVVLATVRQIRQFAKLTNHKESRGEKDEPDKQ